MLNELEKRVYYPPMNCEKLENSPLSNKKKTNIKPFLRIDQSEELILNSSHYRRFLLVKRELLKKFDYSNCFPIFRNFFMKLLSSEKVEDLEHEVGDEDKKLKTPAVGSIQIFFGSGDVV